MKLKPLVLTVITTSILLCGAVLTWLLIPIKSDPGSVDTSVVFANTSNVNSAVFREDYFEYDGHSLHYVDAGKESDDVILFIHGFPSYWLSFIRQMQAFKADYRVVAIDGLGAGRSDAPGNIDAYKLEAMTAHVNALIDHLSVDKVHIVGHDWGSAFAIGFAQRYPERVHTVTGLSAPPQSVILHLLETYSTERKVFDYVNSLKKSNSILLMALGIPDRIWKGAYEPLVAEGKLNSEEGELFREATGNPKRINAHINWYRANIPAFDNITGGDYWPSRDARVTMPALFIWGGDDRIITPNAINKIESISDNLILLPLEGVGHWPHVEKAEIVTSSIRALLSRHTSDSEKSD